MSSYIGEMSSYIIQGEKESHIVILYFLILLFRCGINMKRTTRQLILNVFFHQYVVNKDGGDLLC